MELQIALYEFFSSFGVPCYMDNYAFSSDVFWDKYNFLENTETTESPIPKLPYITIHYIDTPCAIQSMMTVRVWSRSTSFREILTISDKIKKAIPESSTLLKLNNELGFVVLNRGTPFFQFQPTNDHSQMQKIGFFNILITVYTV